MIKFTFENKLYYLDGTQTYLNNGATAIIMYDNDGDDDILTTNLVLLAPKYCVFGNSDYCDVWETLVKQRLCTIIGYVNQNFGRYPIIKFTDYVWDKLIH